MFRYFIDEGTDILGRRGASGLDDRQGYILPPGEACEDIKAAYHLGVTEPERGKFVLTLKESPWPVGLAPPQEVIKTRGYGKEYRAPDLMEVNPAWVEWARKYGDVPFRSLSGEPLLLVRFTRSSRDTVWVPESFVKAWLDYMLTLIGKHYGAEGSSAVVVSDKIPPLDEEKVAGWLSAQDAGLYRPSGI